MDDVKKKVLLDLFGSPLTVLPIVGGVSAWLLSWAVDGSTILNLGGLVGVLGGLGMLATRVIFGIEQLTENAFQYLAEQERAEQEAALDKLERRLRKDKDPRTQKLLRDLRRMYDDFQSDVEGGKLPSSARTVKEKVDDLFRAAVKHLEHSYDLWQTSRGMSGNAKNSLADERDGVVQEVKDTVEHLGRTIEQFHAFRVRESESELSKLRDELDETLRVAKRAEERLATLDQERSYDPAEFEIKD